MKILLRTALVILALYVIVCICLYAFQEKLIFMPRKLSTSYTYHFPGNFEEKQIRTHDGVDLNGLLFKSDSAKGLVFSIHGNTGALDGWGEIAPIYTMLGYDFFIWDYRSFGKSGGDIGSEQQFHQDAQTVYDELKKLYPENRIIIIGYSIGTGPAARLASVNHPRLLILQAPYYNLSDMMNDHYPVIPGFILRYKFETNIYIKACKMPVVIFHGDYDGVIDYQSSVKLEKEFKTQDTLITLSGQTHNGINENTVFRDNLSQLLQQ